MDESKPAKITEGKLPKLRPLEAFPIDQGGVTYICLRDPGRIAPDPILLGMGAYFLAAMMDGSNDVRDLQAAFMRRFGELLPTAHLEQLLDALDRGYFLESPRFFERIEKISAEFRRAPYRPPALAGLCYASEPARLNEEIEGFFLRDGAPGEPPPSRHDGAPLSGLISPHIDPRRGARAYAHAYGELRRRQRPELVVILGTSHYGSGAEPFTATRKDYMTPLGALTTDRAMLERLAARYGEGDLFAEELLHRNEHSIEFQALFLAWALGVTGYQVLPILVGSFHQMVERGQRPIGNERVRAFIETLSSELASEGRRCLIIAGVDFAHVGRKFGDTFAADEETAKWIRSADLQLIQNIERGDPEGFFDEIARERDARKICGLSPMYTQLALLRGHRGRLLIHDIAMEPETESLVSFASVAIEKAQQ